MIKCNNVKIEYKKSKFNLDIKELEIHKSSLIALIGPNGAGKTTLLKILAGLEKSFAGEILFNQKNIGTFTSMNLAKEVVYVPAEFYLEFDFTVYDFVTLARTPYLGYYKSESIEDKNIVLNALKFVDGEHLKDRKINSLSSGEKQRVLLAKAIAQDTKILLLDEVSSNQDINHKNEFFKKLSELANKGKTIIVSSHDLTSILLYANEAIVIDENHNVYKMNSKELSDKNKLNDIFKLKDINMSFSFDKKEILVSKN